MNIKTSLKVALAAAALFFVSGCDLLDGQADQRLGEACSPEVRVARAAMLTDMLDFHYGAEMGARIERLQEKVSLMHQAAAAGSGLDAAGDAYKGDFVGFAAALLAKRGVSVAIGGYAEAVDRLKVLPELVADINEIEAKVQIACARSSAFHQEFPIMSKHVFDPPDLLPVLIDPKGGPTPFVLASDFEYRSAIVTVKVDKGFRYDMASVPRWAWPLLPRTDPRIVRAATVHDKLYRTGECDRHIADGVFLSIMKHDNMPAVKRWAAYLAVRAFGGRNFGKGEPGIDTAAA